MGKRVVLLSEKGMAFTIVMGLMTIISLLGFGAVAVSHQMALNVSHQTHREQAFHYAEAGANRVLWLLNEDSTFVSDVSHPWREAYFESDHDMHGGGYRLEFVPPSSSSTNERIIQVRATGWSNANPDLKRTVLLDLRERSFIDSVWCTHEETMVFGGVTYQVFWATGDVIYGPVHTNGRLHMMGNPEFYGSVTYSGAAQPLRHTGGASPIYHEGPPRRVEELTFPTNNSKVKELAQLDGLYFSGRTLIWINEDKLHVHNLSYNASQSPPLSPTQVVVFDLPPNGVVYVDGDSASDNATSKFLRGRGNVFVSGKLKGRLTIAASNSIYIMDRNPTKPYASSTASEIVGGVVYFSDPRTNSSSTDMLGLIANRDIVINHLSWPSASNTDLPQATIRTAPHTARIDAAVFALSGSFGFEAWDSGGRRGTIHLYGSIVQNRRGAVAQGNNGYFKDYRHDPRFEHTSPPHFLPPEVSGWEVAKWTETPDHLQSN